MDVFELRDHLVDDYEAYVRSFMSIRDDRIRTYVDDALKAGTLWPEPMVGLNPSFAEGAFIDDLCDRGLLDERCRHIFRVGKGGARPEGRPLKLHRHQAEAVEAANRGSNYVLTTGTGSGKSLSYIVPIVDRVLRDGPGQGIKAIVVYPMNALANSQSNELSKFLKVAPGDGLVRFARYTGQEKDEERQRIIANPPDILLTNYVMLELILTRVDERKLVEQAQGLRFLVFDELHTYRGRQGADVALLARRVRDACQATSLQVVGTSATMASGGTWPEQQGTVAEVSSLLFGVPVEPEGVIGETLRRGTLGEPDDAALRARCQAGTGPSSEVETFRSDPLSIWIERTFGVQEVNGRLVRVTPQRIRPAAEHLSAITGVDRIPCEQSIKAQLMAGYQALDPATGFPVFAFRLHQFISRGDTVYASLETEVERSLTLEKQTFVLGDRSKVLLPLTFCRECGQEYYQCRRVTAEEAASLEEVGDAAIPDDASNARGHLYLSTDDPWPATDSDDELDRLPPDWIEDGPSGARVKTANRKHRPVEVHVATDGRLAGPSEGRRGHFLPGPFRFCLHCGVTYGARQRTDFQKLTTLGSEGRSTATTILSLSAVRRLRRDETLEPEARKLLCFTDNRQDASLQAGHFNDFVEVGLLRSALYRAAKEAGDAGLFHDQLTARVFDALALDLRHYASNPEVEFGPRRNTEKALRDVLGYRLYLDQRRGWRLTQPNLEQVGLLRIEYPSLSEGCASDRPWDGKHHILTSATPSQREELARTLLDVLRRDLAIKVDYLKDSYQEGIQLTSNQWLKAPWALDENEQMEAATIAFPRSRRGQEFRGNIFISGRSGFGQYLRRKAVVDWKLVAKLTLDDRDAVIGDLFEALVKVGTVEPVLAAKGADDVPGYQLQAAEMSWVSGTGERGAADPIRVPRAPDAGHRPNEFFRRFYESVAVDAIGLEAREHTAQVQAKTRQEREQRFSSAELPILFCSPTMELGVDIAQLNVVGLRNVPPTPANYAQRSGRAGRQGQPALVITYCSTGSPHDQWFFRRPEQMVAGAVSPPRLDVANEDLVRAHVDAIWLAEADLSLRKSLSDLLDVAGDHPTLELLDEITDRLRAPTPRSEAISAVRRVLADLRPVLTEAPWWTDQWIDDAVGDIDKRFWKATERWRTLYASALAQAQTQSRIIQDASRSRDEIGVAKRLRAEAENQLQFLRSESDQVWQSDFYSYRYFASEGFLPGYSFPRLPLSAYIPGRIRARGQEEFLSRARFLAISEFGPRNFVYHEGSRYVINRVILPVGVGGDDGQPLFTDEAKVCVRCGYLHLPGNHNVIADICESCEAELPVANTQLFRMQNVATKRRDRISSDEEERSRHGYDLRTAIRFASNQRGPLLDQATIEVEGSEVGSLAYGHAATLWRINLGWRRRGQQTQQGFVLDARNGYWAKRDDTPAGGPDDGDQDPMSGQTIRVTPYVEDTRNSLLLNLGALERPAMLSLQAALRTAVQLEYQLEESEIAAEPLPDRLDPTLLLLFEASEGGAGVLRRLVEDPVALGKVARRALEVCHEDPDTGEAQVGACEAACYDCLLSYGNQPDHRILDRQRILPLLRDLAGSKVLAGAASLSRAEQLTRLRRLLQSDLERSFLEVLDRLNFRLPTAAQELLSDHGTRPDFIYELPGGGAAALYIDGPLHLDPRRANRDRAQQASLEDDGWIVLRFAAHEDWETLLRRRPDVFGPAAAGDLR